MRKLLVISLLFLLSSTVGAQAITSSHDGLYCGSEGRYCWINRYAEPGVKWLAINCGFGYGSSGQAFVSSTSGVAEPFVGPFNAILYRLDGAGGYLTPVPIYDVTIAPGGPDQLLARFGSDPRTFTLYRAGPLPPRIKPSDR